MEKKVKQIIGIIMIAFILLINTENIIKVSGDTNTYDIVVDVKYGQTEARTMLEKVNAFRLGSDAWYWNSDNSTKTICTGLKSLSYDYKLEKIAMQRAAEIALSFDHVRPNGTKCFTAYSENEYVYISAGENIAAGYSTAASTFTGWKEDNEKYAGQGHRRNMLDARFNAIGIGHAYYNGTHYWVQEFAFVSSLNIAPTVANDSSTNVDVKISAGKVSNIDTSDSISDLTLKCGETKEISGSKANFKVTGSFPATSRTGIIYPQVVSTNSSIVQSEGNKIKAISSGIVTIKLYYLGQEKECQVTVSHNYVDKKVDSTCITKGYTLHECKSCGDSYKDNYTEVGEHNYITKQVISEATFTETGLKTVVCTECGGTKQVILPILVENGWREIDGKAFWYENGVIQGYKKDDLSYRGKEIFDPESNSWYWLDNVQGGAKAVNKDVYQESEAGIWGNIENADGTRSGKWVRYDANGHMIKGWSNNSAGNKFYFDKTFGTMAKGYCTIDGVEYYFNDTNGKLEKIVLENIDGYTGWKEIDGKQFWYENGVRQGYSVNSAYRGKEIFDPNSNAWYWLDNVQGGAKAVSKDVYQESIAGAWGNILNSDGTRSGKWVRYDENGHMIKGWTENSTGKYYFDPIYGTMAKGNVTINGLVYYFDKNSGVLQ